MAFETADLRGSTYATGATALLIAIASILVALAFEHLGGYVPCMLCLMQRWAYYAGIPLLFLGLVLVSGDARRMGAAVFVVVALAFLANAGLGVYHAGAEWKFWLGPETCGGAPALATSTDSLLKTLKGIRVVRCDEAALRVLGLSFAGWNVIVSLLLAALSLKAAISAARAGRA